MTAPTFDAQGTATPGKLARIGLILPWVIDMSEKHLLKHGGQFRYIDANAGPGIYEGDGGRLLEGSPILAVEALKSLRARNRAYLIEREWRLAEHLYEVLVGRGFEPLLCTLDGNSWVPLQGPHDSDVWVICDDNRTALGRICREPHGWKDRGLILFDPKGAMDFDLVDATMRLPTMAGIDVLANVHTTILKRVRGVILGGRLAGVGKWATKDPSALKDRLPLLHKARILVSPPVTHHGWSLILGSNWKKFPEWRRGHLYAADSEIGKALLDRLSYSKPERHARDQGAMF